MNQPAGEAAEPGGDEAAVASHLGDRAGRAERRIVEVDAAARVAEFGVAGVLEAAPHGLVQQVRERAHLGDEGEPAAADLADGAAAHQHPLRHRVPVHPPDLDRGIVPAAVEDVGLGDGVRGQHALGVLGVDREVGAAADLGGGEAGLGLEGDAAERQAGGRGR